VFIKEVTANPLVKIAYNDVQINSHLIGLYNANNINAAITIGAYFEIPDNQIKEAIESYIPENNRSQLLTKGTNEIILDAYNANPSSMKVALENFLQLENANKVAIIGDMFELGEASLTEHKMIIEQLLFANATQCNFIGSDFYSNKTNHNHFHFFENFDDFASFLKCQPLRNKMILIKGSRGLALERTLDYL